MSELEDFLTQTEQNIISDRLKEIQRPSSPIHPNCRCWYGDIIDRIADDIEKRIKKMFEDS